MSTCSHDGNIVAVVERQRSISTKNEVLSCSINVQIRWMVGHQIGHGIHTVAWQAGINEEGLDIMPVAAVAPVAVVVPLQVQARGRRSLRLAAPRSGAVLEAGGRPGRRPGVGAQGLLLLRGDGDGGDGRGRGGRRGGFRGHGHRRPHAHRHSEAFVCGSPGWPGRGLAGPLAGAGHAAPGHSLARQRHSRTRRGHACPSACQASPG